MGSVIDRGAKATIVIGNKRTRAAWSIEGGTERLATFRYRIIWANDLDSKRPGLSGPAIARPAKQYIRKRFHGGDRRPSLGCCFCSPYGADSWAPTGV